tara:strand:- start:400 stop:657 length:258 start_codon:yes stop_codon:yes gene_type:complete
MELNMNITKKQKAQIDKVLSKYDDFLNELSALNPKYLPDEEFVNLWSGRRHLENSLYSKIKSVQLEDKYPLQPIGGIKLPNNEGV